MRILLRSEYNYILSQCDFKTNYINDIKPIDIYHKNNWDRNTVHWDEDSVNEKPLMTEFFFDAKTMIEFLKRRLMIFKSEKCYLAAPFLIKRKVLLPVDYIQKDVYSGMKKLYNTKGLKINTDKVFEFNKEEFKNILDVWGVSGFLGLSEHTVLFPEDELSIMAYHHMNYLIYTKNPQKVMLEIKKDIFEDIIIAK